MLTELLRLAAEEGAHSYAELAARLDIPPSMIGALLEDLARRGYVRPLAGGCDARCATCPLGRCAVSGAGQVWVLTARGLGAARD